MVDLATATVRPSFTPDCQPCFDVRLAGIPYPLDRTAIPQGASLASTARDAEIFVLNEHNAAALLAQRIGFARAAICPTINAMPGSLDAKNRLPWVDMAVPAASRTWLSEALCLLQDSVARIRSLPEDVLETTDLRMALLARLYVRNRGLEPRRDPNSKETVSYAEQFIIPRVEEHAEDLVCNGLLDRSFFDALPFCPRCESGRLSAREHCVHCGGRNLVTQPVLHHLKCAHQAPEAEFRREGGLVCPKCSQRLEHFSVDYDRPGTVAVCRTCGRSCDDAVVAFLCLDCEAENAADDCGERTVYRYSLTPAAETYLRSGAPLPAPDDSLRPVRERMMRFIGRETATGRPFCIVSIRLTPPEGVSPSSRSWAATCVLYSTLLRECFVPEVEFVESGNVFLALIPGDSKDEIEAVIPDIRARTERFLTHPPHAEYAVFGPEEALRLAAVG